MGIDVKSFIRNSFNKLAQPVNAAPFVSFRIVFGFLMAFSTIRFVFLGWIEDHYTEPLFHFHYFGFDWIHTVSASWLYMIHILMILASIGIMTGYLFRVSSILLFLCFTYT